MFAKIGPGREHHLPPAGRRILLDDVGARDVGRHQVRRELDAVELQVEHLRQRPDEQRLRQPGHADDQAVAADEQRQQHLIDDVLLPDDELAELGLDAACARRSSVGQRDVLGRIHRHGLLLNVHGNLSISTRADSTTPLPLATSPPPAIGPSVRDPVNELVHADLVRFVVLVHGLQPVSENSQNSEMSVL